MDSRKEIISLQSKIIRQPLPNFFGRTSVKMKLLKTASRERNHLIIILKCLGKTLRSIFKKGCSKN